MDFEKIYGKVGVAYKESFKMIVAAMAGAVISNLLTSGTFILVGIGVLFVGIFFMFLVLEFDSAIVDTGESTSNTEKLDVIKENTDSIEERVRLIEEKNRFDWANGTTTNNQMEKCRSERDKEKN